jgi:hypothetical protein
MTSASFPLPFRPSLGVSDPQAVRVEHGSNDLGDAPLADLLDVIMPRWTRREFGSIRCACPRQSVMSAVERLTWSEVPLLRLLVLNRFGGRTINPGTAVLSSFRDGGHYALMAKSTRARVYGSLLVAEKDRGRVPDPLTAASLRAHHGPGVAVLLGFGQSEGRILTETRCLALDPVSRRALAAYWLLIRPTSGLLQRGWLSAVRERAQWTLTTSPVTGDIV